MSDLKSYLSELVEDGAKSGTIRTEDLAVLLSRLEQAEQLARINNQAMLEQAQRAGQAEQAVQRVRELAEEFDEHDYPRGIHRFSVAKRIRRALDGDGRE